MRKAKNIGVKAHSRKVEGQNVQVKAHDRNIKVNEKLRGTKLESVKEIGKPDKGGYIKVIFYNGDFIDILYEDEKELKRMLNVYKKGVKVSRHNQGVHTIRKVEIY